MKTEGRKDLKTSPNSSIPEFPLVRKIFSDTETIGTLLYEGQKIAYTLELPWRDNQKNISCIPCGRYQGNLVGSTIRLHNVPGRNGIKIHVGNSHKDIRGCILLGKEMHESKGIYTLTHSVIAVTEFINLVRKLSGSRPQKLFWIDISKHEES